MIVHELCETHDLTCSSEYGGSNPHRRPRRPRELARDARLGSRCGRALLPREPCDASSTSASTPERIGAASIGWRSAMGEEAVALVFPARVREARAGA